MTFSPLRTLALVAAALLALGGCAVPGMGEPGVAAVYRDRIVTDGDITSIRHAMDDLYSGPNSGEDLTLLLIGPEVIAIADQLDLSLTDDQLLEQAGIWITYATEGQVTDLGVTPGALEVVRIVEDVNLLMHDPDGLIALTGLVQDIEDNSTISPRYGDFTLENFSNSVATISKYITENETGLSFAQFVVWKDINGFVMTNQPDWISGG
jgi:hypothetical protein